MTIKLLTPSRRAKPEGGRSPISRSPGRLVLAALKLVGTAAACVWILSLVDWPQFWSSVRGATYLALVGVVILRFGGLALSAFKWQLLLALHGVSFRLGLLVRWYLVATFLNHFLPTSIGGDAYRVYRTLDNARSRSCAVLAIFMERATGFLALLVLGFGAALATSRRIADEPLVGVVLLVSVSGIVLATSTALLGPRLIRRNRTGAMSRWAQRLIVLRDLLRDFSQQPRKLLVVGSVSFLFHANRICVTWLVLYALGAPLDPVSLTLVLVGVEAVGLLPISLGGLGVVDGSFIFLAGRFGIAPEPALAAMLILRILNLPLSLVGAYFYARGESPSRPAERSIESLADGVIPHTSKSRV